MEAGGGAPEFYRRMPDQPNLSNFVEKVINCFVCGDLYVRRIGKNLIKTMTSEEIARGRCGTCALNAMKRRDITPKTRPWSGN